MVGLPNTNPVLDNPDSLTALSRPNARDDAPTPHLYAYGAATKNLDDEAMAGAWASGRSWRGRVYQCIKPISDSLIMRRIMDYSAMLINL